MRLAAWMRSSALVAATLALAGCGIGYNKTLFFTTSNVGLNVETAPPTAELSISRRENVIGPSFEDGVKLPVLASFQSAFTGILGVMANISSIFAGGDAADTMSMLFDDPGTGLSVDSTRCVSTKPEPRTRYFDAAVPAPGDVRPFVFGTDTSFGLKVRWSGATAQYPDSVKLGYNRKEWALASIFARPASSVSGRVASTETTARNTQVVTFATGWIYIMTPRTVILRGGEPVAFTSLAAGDTVDIYGTYLVRKQDDAYIPAAVSPGVRNAPCSWGEWEVHMPSFVASIDHTSNISTPGNTGTDHVQFFATGAAATSLARREAIRKVMIRRLDPKVAAALKDHQAHQTRQIDALEEIEKLFGAATAEAKAKILARARALQLLPGTTTTATFANDLSDSVDGGNPNRTTALGELLAYARNPQ